MIASFSQWNFYLTSHWKWSYWKYIIWKIYWADLHNNSGNDKEWQNGNSVVLTVFIPSFVFLVCYCDELYADCIYLLDSVLGQTRSGWRHQAPYSVMFFINGLLAEGQGK